RSLPAPAGSDGGRSARPAARRGAPPPRERRHAVAAGRVRRRRSDRAGARGAIEGYGGRFVKETGDGVLAVFDAPARGIECAKRLRSALSHAGIAIRAGIHTGEIELRGEDVSGIGVHIAARVAALAGTGELLVSRTVKDLVSGSEYAFASRGSHRLRGIPERWELLSVR